MKNPQAVTEHERDSPTVNVWCTLMMNESTGPFFFEERTVTGDNFLAMMENTASRHVPVGTIFQLHGAPPHFPRRIHAFLDGEFPHRWTVRGGIIPWPLVLLI
jgi:hypothetical protein